MKETSKKVARFAAKGLKHPEALSPDEIKAVCASALAQSEIARRQPLFTLLADTVREMLSTEYLPADSYWRVKLGNALREIEGK
jgi:hypothetical protein